jgi:Ca-activated chloride channel family protein
MTTPLPTLTDQEIERQLRADEDAGFGSLATEKGHLPLKAMDIHADLDGLLVQVTLRQTFVNNLGEPLEATYIFPLPDRAAVTSFRMEVAGRVVEGVLKERGAARRDYDQAIQAGQRAAITEEERPGVFTLRVGNLMPGEEVNVRLIFAGPLPYSDGEATFRFPLVVAPRYIPGTPLPGPQVGVGVAPDTDAVPDASRITPPVLLPGYPNPVRLSLSVDVRSGGLPLRDFRSSLHALAEEERGSIRRIALHPGERLNRDFILRFRLADEALATALALRPDATGKAGTFLLTLVPPSGGCKPPEPHDLVFVLDRSGSMGGWKMVAARRALARMVDTLTDRDRFTIYAFDESIETPWQEEGLIAATDRNRFHAVEFLSRIGARAGTEMAQPLERAVKQLAAASGKRRNSEKRDRILVLITDGQVGNEDQILRKLAGQIAGVRIFTLGIDRAVNAAFLQRLAALAGGVCELVESEDRLDEVMAAIHRRIGTPVLTGLKLEPAGLRFQPDSLVPSRTPDLFAGAPLFLLGRYDGSVSGGIAFQAADAAGQMWTATVPATPSDNPALAMLWARGRVRELEDHYAAGHGDRDKLAKQIVDTSLKFGVLCRFTAFVAVDQSEQVNPGGQRHRIVQPVDPAEGWDMLGTSSAQSALFMCQRSCAPQLDDEVDVFAADSECILRSEVCYSTPPDPSSESETHTGSPAYTPPRQLRRQGTSPAAPSESVLGRLAKGIKRKLSQGIKSIGETSKSLAIDLTVYRGRALELFEGLQGVGSDQPSRLAGLGILAPKLAVLIADLKSIGAAAAERAPLEKLLRDLQKFLGQKRQAPATLTKLWTRVEAVLRAFADERTTGQAADRRESFWK